MPSSSTSRCPGSTGCEVCRRLREAGDRTPVLMLTARDAVDDRVAGLDAGADDYLVKPFALKELKARLRALLRRSEPAGAEDGQMLRFADLSLDRGAWEANRGPRRLELSRTEFQLLALFLEHPRQVLTRSQIFERVWGYDFGSSSNSLGVYMGYLRRKTEEGGEPRLLHTVRGVGYVLRGLDAPLPLRRRLTLAAAARGRRRGGARGRCGIPRGPWRAARPRSTSSAPTSSTSGRRPAAACPGAAPTVGSRRRRGGPTPYIQADRRRRQRASGCSGPSEVALPVYGAGARRRGGGRTRPVHSPTSTSTGRTCTRARRAPIDGVGRRAGRAAR